jgi:hypothetical protein
MPAGQFGVGAAHATFEPICTLNQVIANGATAIIGATASRTDDPLDKIRTVIRATMRLSVDKLVQLGYARDSAKALLLSMTRGIVGQFDD